MTVQMLSAALAMGRLDAFGAVVDVRSPSEFAEDHLPGAVSWPVLNDEERRLIGTEYAQVSSFDAKKRGAALVAKNIAAHIEREVMNKPKAWRPLVYCWRGGQRSGAMAWFLDQMGFRTHVVEGGYKAFRAAVREALEVLPQRFRYRVVCGKTGSGKTRLLGALRDAGAQVLDLEGLASHRGSVLGIVPGHPQPGQKAFETALWNELCHFDPARPIFIEGESKKVGNLRVPEALIREMRERGECLLVEMPEASRLALLLEDYAFFVRDPSLLSRQLEGLVALRGRETVRAWQAQAAGGNVADVFVDLMGVHYDPGYLKSMQANFKGFDAAQRLPIEDGAAETLRRVASALLQGSDARQF